jgi:hypothetical protein
MQVTSSPYTSANLYKQYASNSFGYNSDLSSLFANNSAYPGTESYSDIIDALIEKRAREAEAVTESKLYNYSKTSRETIEVSDDKHQHRQESARNNKFNNTTPISPEKGYKSSGTGENIVISTMPLYKNGLISAAKWSGKALVNAGTWSKDAAISAGTWTKTAASNGYNYVFGAKTAASTAAASQTSSQIGAKATTSVVNAASNAGTANGLSGSTIGISTAGSNATAVGKEGIKYTVDGSGHLIMSNGTKSIATTSGKDVVQQWIATQNGDAAIENAAKALSSSSTSATETIATTTGKEIATDAASVAAAGQSSYSVGANIGATTAGEAAGKAASAASGASGAASTAAAGQASYTAGAKAGAGASARTTASTASNASAYSGLATAGVCIAAQLGKGYLMQSEWAKKHPDAAKKVDHTVNGATTGATIGSFVPIPGATLIGAGIGAGIGYLSTTKFGKAIGAAQLYDAFGETADSVKNGAKSGWKKGGKICPVIGHVVGGVIGGVYGAVKDGVSKAFTAPVKAAKNLWNGVKSIF